MCILVVSDEEVEGGSRKERRDGIGREGIGWEGIGREGGHVMDLTLYKNDRR